MKAALTPAAPAPAAPTPAAPPPAAPTPALAPTSSSKEQKEAYRRQKAAYFSVIDTLVEGRDLAAMGVFWERFRLEGRDLLLKECGKAGLKRGQYMHACSEETAGRVSRAAL